MKLSKPKVLYMLVSLWLVLSLCVSAVFIVDQHVQDKISTLNYQVVVAKELIVVKRDSVKRQNNQLTGLLSQIKHNSQELPSSDLWYYPGDTLYFQNLLAEYIENIQIGNNDAIQIHSLLIGINQIIGTDASSEEVNQLINDVKATVFYALFSDHQQNPTIYRNFDRIYLISEKLARKDKVVVQKVLSMANKLLEKDASLSNSISQLSSLKLEHEFSHLHEKFHFRIHLYLISYGLISLVVLCSLLIMALKAEQSRQNSIAAQKSVMKKEQSESAYDKEKSNLQVQDLNLNTDEVGIDLSVLHHSMNGDIEAMKLLLGIFIQEHQNDNNLIRNAILNHNLSIAQNAAHSLKGVSGSIGANLLREIALVLEKELKMGQEPTEQELCELDAQLATAIISANGHLGRLNQ